MSVFFCSEGNIQNISRISSFDHAAHTSAQAFFLLSSERTSPSPALSLPRKLSVCSRPDSAALHRCCRNEKLALHPKCPADSYGTWNDMLPRSLSIFLLHIPGWRLPLSPPSNRAGGGRSGLLVFLDKEKCSMYCCTSISYWRKRCTQESCGKNQETFVKREKEGLPRETDTRVYLGATGKTNGGAHKNISREASCEQLTKRTRTGFRTRRGRHEKWTRWL